ncbi:hypothetical protein O3P69_003186 [Scylla paramamosain]|uniref:Uncharacterized protein n=1 Tax=Scylla paramamosain TaxID=85552 RepID=A0AAW0UKX0_SCYPA
MCTVFHIDRELLQVLSLRPGWIWMRENITSPACAKTPASYRRVGFRLPDVTSHRLRADQPVVTEDARMSEHSPLAVTVFLRAREATLLEVVDTTPNNATEWILSYDEVWGARFPSPWWCS